MTDRGTLKVLVAEDEPAMLSLVARHLRRLGFSVTEASDGDSAWDLAQQVRPDLVLLDVMMPGMSGWEVCKRLKGDGIESAPFRRTGVVMLTGIGDNLNEMTSPLFEADAWLNKPFYFPDLERKIRETLGKHGRPMPVADLEDDEEAAAEEEATLLGGDDGGDRDDDDEDDDDAADDADESRGGAVRRAGKAFADKVKKAVSSAVAKVTGRGAAKPKKVAAKPVAPAKPVAKKAAGKKAAPKKTTPAKKPAPKKAAAKKAPAKKASAKKAPAKKAAAKKASAKKASARKAPAKKAARKAPAKKAAKRAAKRR
jgi:DNA-binding response OmpR family regulator